MGKDVYANNREIAAKNSTNKVLAAMPNVCLSPPSPPAGPIPIPYPVFAMASDTDKGSKKVKIGKKPVILKNKSEFKKSNGDMAATKSFGQGIVTHGLGGPVKHAAWSFNVKFEGKNVCRMGDLVSGNHGSPVQNSLDTGLDVALVFVPLDKPESCEELAIREKEQRENGSPEASQSKTTHATGCYTTPPPSKKSYQMVACSKDVDFVANPAYSEGVGKSSTKKFTKRHVMKWKTLPFGNGKKVRVYKTETHPSENDSNLCGDYEHVSKNNCGKSTHAEARMIEEIMKARGVKGKPPGPPGSLGTLRINVHWDQGIDENGKPIISKDACINCLELMCSAEECGLNIELCSENNEPQTLKDKGVDCEKIKENRLQKAAKRKG